VFSLFAPVDIRRIRDTSLPNLETLILAITSRLIVLKNHPSFPDPEIAPARDALNCIRILTRILPFLYEAEHLEGWEERFFWAKRRKKTRKAQISAEVLFDEAHGDEVQSPKLEEQDYEEAKPLAEELLDTLVDLLFFSSFTIPRLPTAKSKVTYAIWQSGVGCNTAMGSSKEYESNRCEILRLLLTITSKSMYMHSSEPTLECFEMPMVTLCSCTADKRSEGDYISGDMSRQANCSLRAVLPFEYGGCILRGLQHHINRSTDDQVQSFQLEGAL
jgi:hypothetical protein